MDPAAKERKEATHGEALGEELPGQRPGGR